MRPEAISTLIKDAKGALLREGSLSRERSGRASDPEKAADEVANQSGAIGIPEAETTTHDENGLYSTPE